MTIEGQITEAIRDALDHTCPECQVEVDRSGDVEAATKAVVKVISLQISHIVCEIREIVDDMEARTAKLLK